MLSSAILLLFLLPCACGENPAIQLILTNKGLQYGKHAGAGWVQDKLGSVTLPDLSGDFSLLIGSVHYTLSGISIEKCDFPEPSVEFFQNSTGLKASLSGLSVALTGEWTSSYGIIHDEGTFSMAVFNVDVLSVVELGRDADGRLSLSSLLCEAHVQDVQIQIRGGASWIIQLIVDHNRGRIRGDIESRICPQMEEAIVELERHLQAVNVSFDVGEALSLDLPLSLPPVVSASALSLGLKGEFYSIKTHKEPPFEAQPFTLPPQPGYMLSVGLSEFTLNSAFYGFFSSGLLQLLVDDGMLAQMFPDLLMNLQVYAREAPMFSLQPDAGKLSVEGTVKAFAIFPNGTQIPVFTLDSESLFSSKMRVADGRVKGSVTMDNLTLSLVASEVGPFSTDSLEKMVRMGVKMVVLPKINQILASGILLPRTKYGQLVNSVLTMEEVSMSEDVILLKTKPTLFELTSGSFLSGIHRLLFRRSAVSNRLTRALAIAVRTKTYF
uniref:Bactericidal permeability-increasing protein n=1 Tax=Salarias fasciatus TaxID=181472 RepID=A0A672G362_SALFA